MKKRSVRSAAKRTAADAGKKKAKTLKIVSWFEFEAINDPRIDF